MSKSADAFRTISEVAEWLETPAHVLRFWESKFTQVKPVKRAGGRRYYRPADMKLLGGIKKLLHEDGLTIKGAQKVLREQGIRHVSSLCALSLGDEFDNELADMQDVALADPVDTVVPFVKPESLDDEGTAVDMFAAQDDAGDVPLSESMPSDGTENEVPVVFEQQADTVTSDTPEPDVAVAEDLTAKNTLSAEPDLQATTAPDAIDSIAPDTAFNDPDVPAVSPVGPQDDAADDPMIETASGLPGFLQHSMQERQADDRIEAESVLADAAPSEPAAPMPGLLTHLSKLSHLPAQTARDAAPLVQRLRDMAR